MAKGDLLGEFEQLVILALLRVEEPASGMRVRLEIAETGGRSASIGAVYATLDRLESKGLVVSGQAESIQGRARRLFEVTAAGRSALAQTRRLFDAMWDGGERRCMNCHRGSSGVVRLAVRTPHCEYLLSELEEYHLHMKAAGRPSHVGYTGLTWQLLLILGSLLARPSLFTVFSWSGYLFSDLRRGMRSIVRTPVVTIVAVVTLALGLGATAVVFSLVDAALLTPLPYSDPDRIVRVWGDRTVSKEVGLQFMEETRSFETASLFHPTQVVLTGDGAPERLNGLTVLPQHFSVLGVNLHLGRAFGTEATLPDAQSVAILSFGLWQRRFSGDSSVVGRTISLEGEPTTVVGIVGSEHVPLVATTQIWIPMEIDRGDYSDFTGVAQSFLIGRLGSGFTELEAASEVRTFAERIVSVNPDSYGEDFVLAASVVSVHEAIVSEESRALKILMISVSLVLLICCANVTNLLLSHASGRRSEACLRRALGASRGRVVTQFMIEYGMLGAFGGVGGALLGQAAIQSVLTVLPVDFPMRESIALDGRVLLFAFLVTVPSSLLIGILPALGATGGSLGVRSGMEPVVFPATDRVSD